MQGALDSKLRNKHFSPAGKEDQNEFPQTICFFSVGLFFKDDFSGSFAVDALERTDLKSGSP